MSQVWHEHLAHLSWWEQIDRFFFPSRYTCTIQPLSNWEIGWIVLFTILFVMVWCLVLQYIIKWLYKPSPLAPEKVNDGEEKVGEVKA